MPAPTLRKHTIGIVTSSIAPHNCGLPNARTHDGSRHSDQFKQTGWVMAKHLRSYRFRIPDFFFVTGSAFGCVLSADDFTNASHCFICLRIFWYSDV